MIINHKNIEELIFEDKKVQSLLPQYKTYFDQWIVGKRNPALRFISNRVAFSLLEKLTDEIPTLEDYFKEEVIVESVDFRSSKSITTKIDELDVGVFDQKSYKDFCISRDRDHCYISFWR